MFESFSTIDQLDCILEEIERCYPVTPDLFDDDLVF